MYKIDNEKKKTNPIKPLRPTNQKNLNNNPKTQILNLTNKII